MNKGVKQGLNKPADITKYTPDVLIEILQGVSQVAASLCTNRFCENYGKEACPNKGKELPFCEPSGEVVQFCPSFILKPGDVESLNQALETELHERIKFLERAA